jgi:hypothetical protein
MKLKRNERRVIMLFGTYVDDHVRCDDCGEEKGNCTRYQFTFKHLTLCDECNPFNEDEESINE